MLPQGGLLSSRPLGMCHAVGAGKPNVRLLFSNHGKHLFCCLLSVIFLALGQEVEKRREDNN